MVELPTALVYIGTAALIVVCCFLGVLLYYLIKLTRIAIVIAYYIERWEGRIEGGLDSAGRTIRLIGALFGYEK